MIQEENYKRDFKLCFYDGYWLMHLCYKVYFSAPLFINFVTYCSAWPFSYWYLTFPKIKKTAMALWFMKSLLASWSLLSLRRVEVSNICTMWILFLIYLGQFLMVIFMHYPRITMTWFLAFSKKDILVYYFLFSFASSHIHFSLWAKVRLLGMRYSTEISCYRCPRRILEDGGWHKGSCLVFNGWNKICFHQSWWPGSLSSGVIFRR